MTLATSIDRVEALRPSWEALAERMPRVVPNVDPDRYLAALRSIEDVLPYVVLFSADARPRGLLIGRTSRGPVPCSVGYIKVRLPAVVGLDIVYGGLMWDRDDAEVGELAAERLLGALRDGAIERVRLNHTGRDDPFLSVLSRKGGRAFADEGDKHWSFVLGKSYEETLSAFSGKHRKNIRRMESRLRERFGGDVEVRMVDGSAGIDDFTARAKEIAGRTYQAGLGQAFDDTPVWRAILQTEAGRGRLRGYLLEAGGVPIAFQVGAVYRRTYFLEAMGFRTEHRDLSPGTFLLLDSTRDLSSAGIDRIDYGFGDAEYKRIYGDECWEEADVFLYGKGLRPRLSGILQRAAILADRTAGAALEGLGFHRRIKNLWRSRLSKGKGR